MLKSALALGACVALFAVTTAEAARCPSGQIYRVSKKTCMDKSLAIKQGIIKQGSTRSGRQAPANKKSDNSPKAVAPVAVSSTTDTDIPRAAAAAPLPPPRPDTAAIRPEPRSQPTESAVPQSSATPAAAPAARAGNVAPQPVPPVLSLTNVPDQSARPANAADMQALKDRLKEHIARNRGKLTKRALEPGS